jgi:hypothetical protein
LSPTTKQRRRAVRFAHELLHDEVGVEAAERFDHAERGAALFGEQHALSLRTFVELDDMRRLAKHGQQVGGVFRVVAEHGGRQVDAFGGEQLQRAQLVARAQDRVGIVRRVRAHFLELAHDGGAVERDRRADARDHCVETAQQLAAAMHLERAGRDAHVTAQRIEHAHGVAAFARGFDEASRGIQARIARKDGDFHAGETSVVRDRSGRGSV